MKWYSDDPTPPQGQGNGNSGGSSPPRGNKPFRLKIFTGLDKGRDVLYLGDDVFRFWEHHGKDANGRWSPGVHGICRKKNNIGDGMCPPCELGGNNINLYSIGFFSAIDISFGVGKEFRGERNLYLMEKRLVGAKVGTADHPGPLADLHRIRERHGRLAGVVVHQIRKGKKSPTIGDSFEVVEKLDPTPEAMLEYLKFRVRQMIKDGTIKRACDEVQIGMPSKEFYQQKIGGLELQPFDYESFFVPMGPEELANHFSLPWSPSLDSQQSFQGQQESQGADGGRDPFAPDYAQDPFDYGSGGGEAPPSDSGTPSGDGGGADEDMPF